MIIYSIVAQRDSGRIEVLKIIGVFFLSRTPIRHNVIVKRTVVILILALIVSTAQSEPQRPPIQISYTYNNVPLPLIYFGLGISLLQIAVNGVAQVIEGARTGPQQATMAPVPGYCYGNDHPLSATASSREACALFDLKPE